MNRLTQSLGDIDRRCALVVKVRQNLVKASVAVREDVLEVGLLYFLNKIIDPDMIECKTKFLISNMRVNIDMCADAHVDGGIAGALVRQGIHTPAAVVVTHDGTIGRAPDLRVGRLLRGVGLLIF